MPHNEVDQIDYMEEVGDMLDFADDVDGNENNGGDLNLDDYDMLAYKGDPVDKGYPFTVVLREAYILNV
ncbi:hypothetical protein L2E82_44933 [Cichorium intybus]|uniref:Uncharacterized protein n=1 Tax=Cichorium intybus TaxID=13427 RepID=A0ACB8ZR65_CICIN|nr:hypothetical protein L2E82_44933 [Cichorium intybus]